MILAIISVSQWTLRYIRVNAIRITIAVVIRVVVVLYFLLAKMNAIRPKKTSVIVVWPDGKEKLVISW